MAVADRRGLETAACECCGTVGRGSERRPGPAAVSTHRRYPPAGGAGTDSQVPMARLGLGEVRTGERRIDLPPNSHKDGWSLPLAATGTVALALERNFPHIAREAARSALPVPGKRPRRPADPDLVVAGEHGAASLRTPRAARMNPRRRPGPPAMLNGSRR